MNTNKLTSRGNFMHYAHTDEKRNQTLKDHLINTAKLASENSVEPFKGIAYTAGLIHDIGKYADAFQERLLNNDQRRFEHSACGAIELDSPDLIKTKNDKCIAKLMQYCIAGHHSGLPDGGNDTNTSEDSTLKGRLKRSKNYTGRCDYSRYKDEISLSVPECDTFINALMQSCDNKDFIEKYAFFTRYIFSCLTDADFIDTESFCHPDIKRGLKADFKAISESVDKRLNGFSKDTPLKKARGRLQEQALKNSDIPSEINILSMPTGSGKTLCSLKLALNKLKRKKRIIYVIPYTSIIEQTAEGFENIFGEYADILQHHSNFSYESTSDIEQESSTDKLKRAAENWDAPFVITTSVQFFQSLYHYKSSSLRKLHNYADSVIIFDEVHMLPVELLRPCLRGIGHITKYLNSEVIFLSATMPDYSELFKKYLPDAKVGELITDKTDYSFFQKCSYSYIGETDIDSIVEKADEYNSSLIVVNSKKTAREVYNIVYGQRYHLSANMTPEHRSKVIAKIRIALKNEEKITVVSTSLIEAGVDLDFETVFRQLSGLDSILQSGGRCNRDGKRENGDVFIFETTDKPQGDMERRASIVKDLLREGMDISSENAIVEYYNRLFRFSSGKIEENSIAENATGIDNIPFAEYGRNFKFIKNESIGIVINNCDETELLLEKLKYDSRIAKRSLQKYSVSLKLHGEFEEAISKGLIKDTGAGVFILADNSYYNEETGLDISMARDIIF